MVFLLLTMNWYIPLIVKKNLRKKRVWSLASHHVNILSSLCLEKGIICEKKLNLKKSKRKNIFKISMERNVLQFKNIFLRFSFWKEKSWPIPTCGTTWYSSLVLCGSVYLPDSTLSSSSLELGEKVSWFHWKPWVLSNRISP